MKVLAFLFMLYTICISAQTSQEWSARYNGSENKNDEGTAIAIDGDGNIYITGSSYSNSIQNIDCITIKYNSAGIQQWVQKYSGPGSRVDRGTAIVVDAMGNVYVAGSSGVAFSDYFTVKYNSQGVQQWVQRYNGPGNSSDFVRSVKIDSSGNVYTTGWSGGEDSHYDYATIKYNSAGIQQWVQRYNGPGNNLDIVNSMEVDPAGFVYITGNSIGNGTSNDYATIKYNTWGDVIWISRYNGPKNDWESASSLYVDLSGNVYVTGSSGDYITIKYNSSGTQQWIQEYNGPANGHDEPTSMALDLYGNVIVTGWSIGIDSSRDYSTVKYNPAGIQQWVQRYAEPGAGIEDLPSSVAADVSGNIYVTGHSMNSSFIHDYATIKYNSAGVMQWLQRYNGTGNSEDWAYSVAVDSSLNVFITGGSIGIGSDMDAVTIKYSQTIGIHHISGEVPKEFLLSQNYPNPFNPTTNIEFSLPKSGMVKLVIYDAMGREIETLVNTSLKAGTYKADWNAANHTSGVYFYKLSAENYNETRKMILIK